MRHLVGFRLNLDEGLSLSERRELAMNGVINVRVGERSILTGFVRQIPVAHANSPELSWSFVEPHVALDGEEITTTVRGTSLSGRVVAQLAVGWRVAAVEGVASGWADVVVPLDSELRWEVVQVVAQ